MDRTSEVWVSTLLQPHTDFTLTTPVDAWTAPGERERQCTSSIVRDAQSQLQVSHRRLTGMELAGAAKYQLEALPKLESYVDEQVANNTYSLDANLALLRFYQINPQSTRVNLVAKVLLKAIMQLPNPDFKACVHLLSERLQSDETVSKVMQLASALETTRFTDFWSVAAGCSDLLASVPGFHDAVRANILHLLGITFQRIHKRVLGSYLQLEGAELDKLVKDKAASGWTVQSSPSGDLVVFPKNQHNQMVVKRTQEVIRLEQVAPVLRSVTVGFY